MTPIRLRLAEMFRPIRHWAPRGYGFIYGRLMSERFVNFKGDPELKQRLDHRARYKVFYDEYLGANVCTDLGDWASRAHYFEGIYYDRTVPMLIDRVLSGGGTFIDVGANRGLHSLYAGRVLGSRGHVYSFEPNPETFEVLKAHLTMNQVRNCTPINIGISDTDAELKLNLFNDGHSGTCSFVASRQVVEAVSVPVRPLDEVLDATTLAGPLLIKIDVEGFEHRVLKGMKRFLARTDATVICELTDEWLRQAGSSADALVADMVDSGYRVTVPHVRYRHLVKEYLDLKPFDTLPRASQTDVVFARNG